MLGTISKSKKDCVSCHIRDGVPTTTGRGYYASQNGTRVLVVERSIGQRIRINGEIEIIVCRARNGEVQLGIDQAPIELP